MTTQICDSLFYDGRKGSIFQDPLEALFKAGFRRPYSILQPGLYCSACSRGYIGHWEIQNDALFLIDILGPWPFDVPFEALSELFDQNGDIRSLCPDCRKPHPPNGGRYGSHGYRCPHCGRSQSVRECPNCKRWCSLVAGFCSKCGTTLESWQCTNCGGTATEWMEKSPPLPPRGFFCIRCGTRIWDETIEPLYLKFISFRSGTAIEEGHEEESNSSKEETVPAVPPIKAKWYSGMLEFPDGEIIEHFTRSKCGALYERDILLHIQKGKLIKKEPRNNLTLDYLAELWIRAERGNILMGSFWKAMVRSPYATPEDKRSRSRGLPPPQLERPIVEVRARSAKLSEEINKLFKDPRWRALPD